MSHLQAFYWLDSGGLPDPGLPRGPWLGSIRRLAVATHVAERSLAVLSEATQLQALAISGGSAEAALQVTAWAAGMPALRRLAVALDLCAWTKRQSVVWRPFKDGLARLQLPPDFRVRQGRHSSLFR